MLKFPKKDKRTDLEKEIEEVLRIMHITDRKSDDYAVLLTHLKGLNMIQRSTKSNRVSSDTWLIVGGNILGLVLILTFEKTGAILSKALGFVLRGRV